jgi:hypothetical protein
LEGKAVPFLTACDENLAGEAIRERHKWIILTAKAKQKGVPVIDAGSNRPTLVVSIPCTMATTFMKLSLDCLPAVERGVGHPA